MSNDFRDSRSPLFQMRKRTFVSDIERGIYDIKDKIDYQYSTGVGLNEDVVRKISARKLEPKWMLDLRLQSLQYFFERPMPDWGADISDLNIQEIIHYIVSDEKPMATDWDQVPEEIKQTFDRLGIPKAEQTSLAGVGAQYDSEVVYHSLQKNLADQGVVYLDMESAVLRYGDLVREHFMKLITPNDHKFAALHQIKDHRIADTPDLRFVSDVGIIGMAFDNRDGVGAGLVIQHEGFAFGERLCAGCLLTDNQQAAVV